MKKLVLTVLIVFIVPVIFLSACSNNHYVFPTDRKDTTLINCYETPKHSKCLEDEE